MSDHTPTDKNDSLAGKRVLITGAAGGIARASASRFARAGARLALTDIDMQRAQTVADEVSRNGGDALAISGDVTRREDVERIMARANEAMGAIDVLVTCAGGYNAYGDFESIEEDDWDRVIALNLKSVFLCCKAVLPYMKPGQWGRIINLGSLAGRSTSAGSSPVHYGAAKAAVSMMTQYLAKDVARYGITANTVAPGTTATERVERLLTAEKRVAFTKATPVGYLAEPDDIAAVVLFLASPESRYITGATLDVNGGRLMLV
jgi:NAD(P)-dependent dehydrogenase (short-subunit alcohol dehydrogenase family)